MVQGSKTNSVRALVALTFATRFKARIVLLGITIATAVVHLASVLVGAAMGNTLPTGIVSAELVHAGIGPGALLCPKCRANIYDNDARYCKYCGGYLESVPPQEG